MRHRIVLALAIAISAPALGYGQAPPGPMPIFQDRCATCHMVTPPPGSRAPSLDALRSLSPEAILIALTTGSMAANATDLTERQKRALAEYIGGRPIGAGEAAPAAAMKNQCRPDAFGDIAKMPAWNGWGADVDNSRFQPGERAGLTGRRRAKAEAEMGVRISRIPCPVCAARDCRRAAVRRGRKLVVYALNAETGCVYWSFRAGASVRSAISVGADHGEPGRPGTSPSTSVTSTAAVFAVNAETGTLIWKQKRTSIRWRASPAPLRFIGGGYTSLSPGSRRPLLPIRRTSAALHRVRLSRTMRIPARRSGEHRPCPSRGSDHEDFGGHPTLGSVRGERLVGSDGR